MDNEFLSLARGGLSESISVTGATQFILRGHQRTGSITDLSEEEKFDLGTLVPNASATLEFAFERFTPALVNGEKVNVQRDGHMKMLRVGKIFIDEVSIKFVLQDPNE